MTHSNDMISASKDAVAALDQVSMRFGQTITNSFVKASLEGKNFETVLQSIGNKLLAIAEKNMAPQLGSLISSSLSGLTNGLTSFANGGIVSAPRMFQQSDGTAALAGEAGPEAILPLQRGPDGKLGLKAERSLVVNVSITTPDVEGFARSEQQVAAAIARAVSRGRRSL